MFPNNAYSFLSELRDRPSKDKNPFGHFYFIYLAQQLATRSFLVERHYNPVHLENAQAADLNALDQSAIQKLARPNRKSFNAMDFKGNRKYSYRLLVICLESELRARQPLSFRVTATESQKRKLFVEVYDWLYVLNEYEYESLPNDLEEKVKKLMTLCARNAEYSLKKWDESHQNRSYKVPHMSLGVAMGATMLAFMISGFLGCLNPFYQALLAQGLGITGSIAMIIAVGVVAGSVVGFSSLGITQEISNGIHRRNRRALADLAARAPKEDKSVKVSCT